MTTVFDKPIAPPNGDSSEGPNGPKMGPKQKWAQMGPNGPKMGPKWAQIGPKQAQMGPKQQGPQMGPKWAQKWAPGPRLVSHTPLSQPLYFVWI